MEFEEKNKKEDTCLGRHHPVARSYTANPADSVEGNRQTEARPRSRSRHRLPPAVIHSNPRSQIDDWQLRLLIK